MLPLHSQAFDKQVESFERSLPIKWKTYCTDGNTNTDLSSTNVQIDDVHSYLSTTCQPASKELTSPAPHPSSAFSSLRHTIASLNPHLFILERDGANDGMVSKDSAIWREEYFVPPFLPYTHLGISGFVDPISSVFSSKKANQTLDYVKGFWEDLLSELSFAFPRPGVDSEKTDQASSVTHSQRDNSSVGQACRPQNEPTSQSRTILFISVLVLLCISLSIFLLRSDDANSSDL
ncbi:hypothetical protein BLNAU_14111 [Blattamonas nauphoetae]|uniref:Uncharacterized protein n=1 Tax=Blattamonas nauphoetae TaxID=2049346 RepID=A0ABQ9XKZ2_9EUKA|nr:hypothetical protein BLNAU_14111 [Blattamonas nauphoetae]